MKNSMKKEKAVESLLVITTGFLLLYCIYKKDWMLFVALGAGITGIFIKPLALLIAKGWIKLGELLGFIVSKVVLTLLFYLLFIPISLLYNLFNKDMLSLNRQNRSLWNNRDFEYKPSDLKNSW
jgi:hypothetical protein